MEKTVFSNLSGNHQNRIDESESFTERPDASPLESAALSFVSGLRSGPVLHDGDDFTLAVRVLPPRRRAFPFGFSRSEYLACYVSRDGDLHLEAAFTLLRSFFADNAAGPGKGIESGVNGSGIVNGSGAAKAAGALKARGFWFLLSDRGGIYLHETVTAEESWKKSGRPAPRLCVLNPENGTACLTPGHRMNREFTARFHDLLDRYRTTPKDAWAREAEKALGLCLEEMRG